MTGKNTDIAQRFEEFGIELCGDSHGWKKLFAEKLGVSPNHVTDILGERAFIGGKMQSKLRALGCDVEWLMTGRHANEPDTGKGLYIHYSGTPNPELALRIKRLGEWLFRYGQNINDTAYLGYISEKFLDGKILDGDGKESQ